MKRWLIYAAISAFLVSSAALITSIWFETQARRGIWAGLGAAWLVQVAAFAMLIWITGRWATRVVVGWTVGTLLRLTALGVVAWLSLGEIWSLPAEPTLLALVTGIFVLLLLEPVVFKRGQGAA